MSARAGSAAIRRTVDIDYDGAPIAVDTGFIVYNELNYPNLTALFAASRRRDRSASDMSFAVSARERPLRVVRPHDGVADGLFAQRRNLRLARPTCACSSRSCASTAGRRRGLAPAGVGSLSLGDYLSLRGFSRRFRDDYLMPMGAAIWSMPPAAMLDFPGRELRRASSTTTACCNGTGRSGAR